MVIFIITFSVLPPKIIQLFLLKLLVFGLARLVSSNLLQAFVSNI